MSDGLADQLVDQLQQSAGAIGKLGEAADAFDEAVAAFRSLDASHFSAVLAPIEVIERCTEICLLICILDRVEARSRLCRDSARNPLSLIEMRAFAQATGRLGADSDLLRQLVQSFINDDADTFRVLARDVAANSSLDESRHETFCFWLCDWIHTICCRTICLLVCR